MPKKLTNKELSEVNAKNAVLIEELENRIRDITGDYVSEQNKAKEFKAKSKQAFDLIDKLQTIIDARLVMLAPSIEEINQYHENKATLGIEDNVPVYITEEVKLLRHLLELIKEPTIMMGDYNRRPSFMDDYNRRMRYLTDSIDVARRG